MEEEGEEKEGEEEEGCAVVSRAERAGRQEPGHPSGRGAGQACNRQGSTGTMGQEPASDTQHGAMMLHSQVWPEGFQGSQTGLDWIGWQKGGYSYRWNKTEAMIYSAHG